MDDCNEEIVKARPDSSGFTQQALWLFSSLGSAVAGLRIMLNHSLACRSDLEEPPPAFSQAPITFPTCGTKLGGLRCRWGFLDSWCTRGIAEGSPASRLQGPVGPTSALRGLRVARHEAGSSLGKIGKQA